MLSTARQGNNPPSDDWLTLDAARRITGESVRTWRRRAEREAGQAHKSGRRALAMKRPGSAGRSTWHVHRDLDSRLRPNHKSRDDQALSAKYPQHVVERALRRAYWLRKWREAIAREPLADREVAERIVREARAAGFSISVRSLYRWRELHKGKGVEGLVDRHRGPHEDGTRSPEAVHYFYDLYHTQSRHSVKVCHATTLRESRRQGWRWAESYKATVAWLSRTDDLSLTMLMREGKDRWARRYLPHIETDFDAIEPGELFVCDHHQCDWWCTHARKQIRPWISAVQDVRSRCIVGWHLGPAPHQDAILASLRMGFRDWAVPRVMRIDNGRDYTSRLIAGVSKRERDRLRTTLGPDWQRAIRREAHLVTCEDPRWLGIAGELGIELVYATPYSPWSKGSLERWFGTFEGQHGKTYATYCGNSTVSKPECLDEIRRGFTDEQKRRLRREHGKDWKRIAVLKFVDQADVPTLEECRERIGEHLDVYHREEHRSLNATPLQVWQQAAHLRRAVADDLAFLMDLRGLYRVGANGVTVTIGAGRLSYGAKSAALKRFAGRKVLVAIDPEKVGHCWAFTPERDRRELIARLESNQRVHPCSTADDVRDAVAEIKRDQSIMHKAARSAARRTKTAAARINEHGQARRRELLATGTDDAVAQPAIAPVHTGFEGVSKGSRRAFEGGSFRPAESGELEDLFEGDECLRPVAGPDEEGMEDLFVDEPASVSGGDEWDGLL